MPPAQQEQLGAGGSLLLGQPHPTAPAFGTSPAHGQDKRQRQPLLDSLHRFLLRTLAARRIFLTAPGLLSPL